MTSSFGFTLEKTQSNARAGRMQTPHGEALTPMFMPVGTRASVKSLSSEDVHDIHPQVVLANTYHLALRPGAERVARLGGLHTFMRYNKPMLTDSGGFQVFSLGEQLEGKPGAFKSMQKVRITDDGVEFSSYLDGSRLFFSPEKSIEIQQQLGADIIMAFDECLPDELPEVESRAGVERTFAWAKRCVQAWNAADRKSAQGYEQALFGIIQGARHKELRRLAAQQITSLPFSGFALGGETIGYNMPATLEVLEWVRDILPEDVPRYAMGLGRDPQNIIDAVRAGYDMFDCVAPTRLARNGALYHGELDGEKPQEWIWNSQYDKGRLQIGNAQYAEDMSPIQEGCDCYTCQQGYTRAYLHHLYKSAELSYYRLASIHNVRTMVRLTEQLRERILHKG